MPRKFTQMASRSGARVRTIVPKKGVYIKVACSGPKGKGGHCVAGEVHHTKKRSSK